MAALEHGEDLKVIDKVREGCEWVFAGGPAFPKWRPLFRASNQLFFNLGPLPLLAVANDSPT